MSGLIVCSVVLSLLSIVLVVAALVISRSGGPR